MAPRPSDLTLLAFFAHPDDESWAAGGCLALCARAGIRVVVACATRGEAGADFQHGLPPGPELGEKRAAELAAACRVLGAAPPVLLDLPDARLASLDPVPIVARIASLITELGAQAAIGLGPDGGYGHRDHLACCRFLRQAVRATPVERRPRLLEAVFPRDLFAPLRRALRRSPARALIATLPQEQIGTERVWVDLAIPIREVSDQKLAAIAAHCSQIDGGDPHGFLWPGLVANLLAEEWYQQVAGPALPANAGDPFTGL